MTIEECKDKVAQKHLFENWVDAIEYHLEAKIKWNDEDETPFDILIDEAMQLYASQQNSKLDAESLAIIFHSTYEGLAKEFGYETREDTKKFDANSSNGKLMIATCKKVFTQFSSDEKLQELESWVNEKSKSIGLLGEILPVVALRQKIQSLKTNQTDKTNKG